MRVAAAISPSATSPADTEPRNIVARPVDSAIVAARAPCRVKCSVVTNVTAAGRGSSPPAAALALISLLIAHHLARWSRCDYCRNHVRSGLLHDAPEAIKPDSGSSRLARPCGAGCCMTRLRVFRLLRCGPSSLDCPSLRWSGSLYEERHTCQDPARQEVGRRCEQSGCSAIMRR